MHFLTKLIIVHRFSRPSDYTRAYFFTISSSQKLAINLSLYYFFYILYILNNTERRERIPFLSANRSKSSATWHGRKKGQLRIVFPLTFPHTVKRIGPVSRVHNLRPQGRITRQGPNTNEKKESTIGPTDRPTIYSN